MEARKLVYCSLQFSVVHTRRISNEDQEGCIKTDSLLSSRCQIFSVDRENG